MKIWRKKKY